MSPYAYLPILHLKIATQTTYPSWGYWLSLGATTCWENWSGGHDASHPPTPTHNHIFLCGGIGEWMYEYLAGVIPTSAGYATVDVKPLVSKTLGPASVDAAITTVRGIILSTWTRANGHGEPFNGKNGAALLTMRVEVPAAVERATVRVPLLGVNAASARVMLAVNGGAPKQIDGVSMQHSAVQSAAVVVGADGDEALEIDIGVGGGVFEFDVRVAK